MTLSYVSGKLHVRIQPSLKSLKWSKLLLFDVCRCSVSHQRRVFTSKNQDPVPGYSTSADFNSSHDGGVGAVSHTLTLDPEIVLTRVIPSVPWFQGGSATLRTSLYGEPTWGKMFGAPIIILELKKFCWSEAKYLQEPERSPVVFNCINLPWPGLWLEHPVRCLWWQMVADLLPWRSSMLANRQLTLGPLAS